MAIKYESYEKNYIGTVENTLDPFRENSKAKEDENLRSDIINKFGQYIPNQSRTHPERFQGYDGEFFYLFSFKQVNEKPIENKFKYKTIMEIVKMGNNSKLHKISDLEEFILSKDFRKIPSKK